MSYYEFVHQTGVACETQNSSMTGVRKSGWFSVVMLTVSLNFRQATSQNMVSSPLDLGLNCCLYGCFMAEYLYYIMSKLVYCHAGRQTHLQQIC